MLPVPLPISKIQLQVMAGKAASTLLDASFNLTANTGSKLQQNKIVTLTLSGGSFDTLANPAVSSTAFRGFYNDNKTAWYTITPVGGADKLSVTAIKVKCDPDVAGDIVITVGGDSGVTGDATVGKYVCPITVASATKPQVAQLEQNQAAGDVTITEVANGALATGATLRIYAPIGVTFSAIPTVKASTGNITLGSQSINADAIGSYLDIPITTKSSVASTITISGIKYDLNKLALDGYVTLNVKDSGFNKNYAQVTNATAVGTDSVQNAVFTIGASTIQVNGADVAAVAPSYISNDRTYLAIRDIAHVLGIADSNIFWDGDVQTVTLMKGDKVVQVKVGSKTMLINGASVPMTVAPEVTSDRVFLPAAFVANAFGATATWDATAQTVTIQ